MIKTKNIQHHNSIILGISPPLRIINTMKAPKKTYVGGIAHSHPYYHINYITEGSLKITFKNFEYDISAGRAFILPPNIPHTIYTEEGYCQIGMDVEPTQDSRGIYKAVKSVSEMEFCITGKFKINTSFEEMDSLILNPTEFNIILTQNLAESILLNALSSLGQKSKSAFAKKFEQILADNNSTSLTLTELCELTGYSRVHLERLANSEFGCGAIEYLNRLKINRICSLLLNTELSASEIAEAEGFYDASHFSVFFKKRIGTTPGKYRKNMLI